MIIGSVEATTSGFSANDIKATQVKNHFGVADMHQDTLTKQSAIRLTLIAGLKSLASVRRKADLPALNASHNRYSPPPIFNTIINCAKVASSAQSIEPLTTPAASAAPLPFSLPFSLSPYYLARDWL